MYAYSETAQKAHLALLEASNHNPTISEFARRVAQAITHYDAGFIRRGPVGSFLLFVPRHVSLNYLLDVLAEEWLGGKPWDESRAFFHIDCSRLTIFNPMVPLELRGGRIGFGGEGATIIPILGRINDPHLAIRGGDFLRKVDSWWRYFRRANVRQEGLLRNRAMYDTLLENLRLTIEVERKRYEEELKEESEFRSVVVFDDLSYITHQEVFRVMQNVIEKGSELIWPNESVDFSHSIVIAIVYDDINESWKRPFGFDKTVDQTGQSGTRPYTYIREIPQLAGLTQLMGDNLLSFPARSLEDQHAQVILRMKDMQRRFAEAGISIDWSKDFSQGLARDTFDRNLRAYTDGRMQSKLQGHVMNPMAGYLLTGKLRHGAKLYFGVTGEEGVFCVRCTIEEEGDGAILTAPDFRGVWEGRKRTELTREEALALIRSDERIANLHGEAMKLLKPNA